MPSLLPRIKMNSQKYIDALYIRLIRITDIAIETHNSIGQEIFALPFISFYSRKSRIYRPNTL